MDDVAPARVPVGTPVDGVHVLAALSPSRAGDFRACPLRYRLRTVDRLPEPLSPDALRGTVVHQVLEDLFDLPAAERTAPRSAEMVPAAWAEVQRQEPEAAALFEGRGEEAAAWLASCRDSLRTYFSLEDPTRLEPAEREVYVEALLESGLLLRGIVDRIDVAADGALRVVDYKTGRSPGAGFEGRALFQLRFYALVLWRTRGVVPAVLRLVYLGDGQLVSYRPDEEDLRATERVVQALWRAMETARESGEWLPNPGAVCRWCHFQEHCPAFGHVPPPLPAPVPGPSEVERQVDRPEPDEALALQPPGAGGHGHVAGHDQDAAAG